MEKILGLILLLACYELQAGVITLQSSDGKKFEIDQEKAEKSITLKNMLEDLNEKEREKLSETPIPFPNIDGSTLEAIVNCLEKPEDIDRTVKSLSGAKLYAFNMAVNYLDIPKLYEKLPAIRWLKQKLELNLLNAGPVLRGHTGPVTSVAISADGNFIATGSFDRTARIWNIDGTERSVLRGHGELVISIAISPDGMFIATGSGDKTARIWNIGGKELTKLEGHESSVDSIAISPDGTFIVTVSDPLGAMRKGNAARIWNADGTKRAKLSGHTGGNVSVVAISPDGKLIVTGSWDTTARIWNIDGSEKATLRGHIGTVYSVAISADGMIIVTGSLDGTARIWNIDGTERAVLQGQGGEVNSVAISPDGKFIVTGYWDGTARIWNIDGTKGAMLHGSGCAIRLVAISPDNTFIVTGSAETINVWNIDGKKLAELGRKYSVTSVAISPDGTFIVTGSTDKTARIWYIGNPGHVNQLNIDQINLLTKIYEQVQSKRKLDLVQKSADTLKIRAQKKLEENLFRTLPPDIQAALHDEVIFPQR